MKPKKKKMNKKISKGVKKIKIKKPIEKKAPEIKMPRITNKTPQLLRGFKDILPSEQKYWELIRSKLNILARDYGFERIDLPLLEETSLFIRSVGKETDIVEKEMFSFEDRGGDLVSLRPEATASIVRSYISHGMLNLPQPVKFFYVGPMFRYDRPQSGRYRQFYQFGFEALGDDHPILDAQNIIMNYNFLKELGLDVNVQINSIGCNTCRKDYKVQLVNYYKTQKHSLCEDCQNRLTKNPLRLLDCKEEKCQAIAEDAPQIIDWLCEECKGHFVKVLEFLDELEIPYNLNPRLVRGLDYYTKTVFEIWPGLGESADKQDKDKAMAGEAGEKDETESPEKEKKAQIALGGGGRYDGLVEMLGGRATAAVGSAFGIERIILKMKEAEIQIPEKEKIDVFVAQLGEAAKRKCLVLFEALRKEGLKIAESFSKDGLKTQLEYANKLGVKYTLILGQKELSEGTILLRDMEGGMQETINFTKIVKEVKKRLEVG